MVSIIAILILIFFNNPVTNVKNKILKATRVIVGPYIHIMERNNDRLFVIEPNQTVLYNTMGKLYYYFEGATSRSLCPNQESPVVRIAPVDINAININGIFNITCSPTTSLGLYNYFKSNSLQWSIPLFKYQHTIIDTINYLIHNGYVHLY